MNTILFTTPGLMEGKEPLAIATVIATRGSSPQKHGNSALFGAKGLIAGTVGGGVLEARVGELTKNIILTKESGLYYFSLDKEITSRSEAICGGHVTILIDGSPSDHKNVFSQVRDSLHLRIPGILATIVSGKEEHNKKIVRHWVTKDSLADLPDALSFISRDEIENLLKLPGRENCVLHDFSSNSDGDSFAFLQPLFPSPGLIIAGAGHIGKALAHYGKLLNFEVTVIDDRAEYANSRNIPDANIIVEDIGKAFETIKDYNDSYIVIVTRGHDDDAKALRASLRSGARYIGMIGSKNKIAKMRTEFIGNGWATEEQWNSIKAPIGVDIKSKTVEEIAVSIAAQLILIRNS